MYKAYRLEKDKPNSASIRHSDNQLDMEFSNPDWGRVALSTRDLIACSNPDRQVDPTEELSVQDFIKEKWQREQESLRKQLLLEDVEDWARYHLTPDRTEQYPFKTPLQYVGGVDISFVKGDNVNACAAFVVLNYPELEVVYEDLSMVQLTAPYIPGFLAFREADFLVQKVKTLVETRPEITPQVILVDGNGILHPRGFGLACHLGVLTQIACIGAAKNLLCVDGMTKDESHLEKIKRLKKAGDHFPLIGDSGKQHGLAYRSCDEAPNPIYISPGHKVSMETALWLVEKCIKYRVPEPTRQADLLSREYLRVNWEKQDQKKKKGTKKKKVPTATLR